ncbi:zf-HC2 domain-containing protein [Streptomyces sp. NBC_01236]|uniref:zf-HC2 domain-containing protein n=1 Tax=Streptomyces sp. NBC_01236 TaxID=2903789 RepID=UPI002E13994A|nr:zf-HC2 domain-containing protein [Streptomyces sp. NBC_01236]
MTEAHCLTKKSHEKTAVEECRTIRELLAGNERKSRAPDEASAVRAHLATCNTCWGECDRLAGVPAHLSLLRDALACGKGRNTRTHAATRPDCSHASPCHRRPHRAALTRQLTLSQWVNRTTSHIR